MLIADAIGRDIGKTIGKAIGNVNEKLWLWVCLLHLPATRFNSFKLMIFLFILQDIDNNKKDFAVVISEW
jgi:hypothetical protein